MLLRLLALPSFLLLSFISFLSFPQEKRSSLTLFSSFPDYATTMVYKKLFSECLSVRRLPATFLTVKKHLLTVLFTFLVKGIFLVASLQKFYLKSSFCVYPSFSLLSSPDIRVSSAIQLTREKKRRENEADMVFPSVSLFDMFMSKMES